MSQHATTQLSELLDKVTSDPALFHADTNCHIHLWKEEGLGLGLGRTGGGGRKGNVIGGSGRGGGRSEGFSLADAGGINTLSLKAKACTPSVYRYIRTYVCCTNSNIHYVCMPLIKHCRIMVCPGGIQGEEGLAPLSPLPPPLGGNPDHYFHYGLLRYRSSSFCQGLGLKLDSLIEDVSHYLQRVEPSSLLSLSRSKVCTCKTLPLHDLSCHCMTLTTYR